MTYWLRMEPGFRENFSSTDTGLSESRNISLGAAKKPSSQDKGAGTHGNSQHPESCSGCRRPLPGFFSRLGKAV